MCYHFNDLILLKGVIDMDNNKIQKISHYIIVLLLVILWFIMMFFPEQMDTMNLKYFFLFLLLVA